MGNLFATLDPGVLAKITQRLNLQPIPKFPTDPPLIQAIQPTIEVGGELLRQPKMAFALVNSNTKDAAGNVWCHTVPVGHVWTPHYYYVSFGTMVGAVYAVIVNDGIDASHFLSLNYWASFTASTQVYEPYKKLRLYPGWKIGYYPSVTTDGTVALYLLIEDEQLFTSS